MKLANNYTAKSLCAVIAILFFLFACSSKHVAQVGDFTITKSMVEQREQVAKIYYPKETSPLGLNQLLRAYTVAQILKNNGQPVGDKELMDEDKRINSNTRAPEMLARIKDVFKNDHEAYLKVFVLPNFVDQVVYPFFLSSAVIQKDAREQAEKFLTAAVIHSAQFEKLVSEINLKMISITVKPSGLVWNQVETKLSSVIKQTAKINNQSAQSVEQAQVMKQLDDEASLQSKNEANLWLQEIIPNLKPGQVFSKLVDRDATWLVLKYLGNQKFNAVMFQKANFENWLKSEGEKVKVDIDS